MAKQPKYAVYIYDDHNTFEHVILCLEMFLGFNMYQAEQVALLVHHKGKYQVYASKNLDDVQSVYEAFRDEGLTVRIDVVE